jgi:hypothetical protein
LGRVQPDRVDALVWALTDLMIDPAASLAASADACALGRPEPLMGTAGGYKRAPRGNSRLFRRRAAGRTGGVCLGPPARQQAGMVPPFMFQARRPGRERKASATGAVVAIQGKGRPIPWSPRDTATLTRSGFAGNPVGFRTVKLIAEAAAALPLVLQDDTPL